MKPQERHAAVFASPLTYTQKIVLLAMCSFMSDGRDTAWPSVGTLKQMTSLGERSIQGVLKAGVKAGWLREDTEAGRRTRTFAIVWEALAAPTPAADAPPPQQMRPAADAGDPAADAPYPAARAPNPAADAPEPIRTDQEPTKEPTKGKGAASEPLVLESPAAGPVVSKSATTDLDQVCQTWFDLWADRKMLGKAHGLGAPRTPKLTKSDRKMLGKALKAGHSVEELERLARWVFLSDEFGAKVALRGEEQGKTLNAYLTPETACRPTKIESRIRLAAMWEGRGSPVDPHLGRPKPEGRSEHQTPILRLVERVPEAKAEGSSMTAFLRDVPEPVQEQFKAAVKKVTGLEAWRGWGSLGTDRDLQFNVNRLRKAVGSNHA